jgi:RHS repeat-associated protein
VDDGTTHVDWLHYRDESDSPTVSIVVDSDQELVSAQRYIEGIDGDLAAIRSVDVGEETDETVLQLSNLHGDTIATASLDPQATQLLDRFESDEYGNPRQAAGADKRYGWLGAKQRRTELASGVVQMGVRSYVPALGRFASVDPVRGGSANDYDYANQDPINTYDLDGRVAGCGTNIKRWRSMRKRRARLNAKWNCPASAWPGNVHVFKMTITIEREVRGTINQIFKGKFEMDRRPYVIKPYAKRQHRQYGVNTVEKCGSGWKYQVKVEVFALLQSPTGIGGGTKKYTSRDSGIMRCR